MDSLISDIPSLIRAKRFDEALTLLRVFLISVSETITRLQSKFNELTCDNDALVARSLSGETIENYPVKRASLDDAIQQAKDELDSFYTEFRACGLVDIIIEVTGKGFSDTVEIFKADFKAAACGMGKRDDLSMVGMNGFIASYATVRGDGACLFRAFLTVMAFQETNTVLPYDPEGMHEWIIRLKLLMCHNIQKMVQSNPDFFRNLQTIQENSTVRTLADYFVEFLKPDYHGTNYDCKVLTGVFGKTIHVIRNDSQTESREVCQTFLPNTDGSLAINDDDVIILYTPGHYDAIIEPFGLEIRAAFAQ